MVTLTKPWALQEGLTGGLIGTQLATVASPPAGSILIPDDEIQMLLNTARLEKKKKADMPIFAQNGLRYCGAAITWLEATLICQFLWNPTFLT